ncbi:MAG: sigma-70 family RNA polymerase sigma factor [Pseudomonadota bacterium]
MTEPTDKRPADADAELVRRAQRELPYRTVAYEQLMRRHERLLFGVCYRMLGNRADAEDAAQDVMVKVFNVLGRFEGRSSFKTWLMRVATNTCITQITRNKRRREISEQWLDERGADQVTEISTTAYDVGKLLADVKPANREVLTLRYVADLSLQEIADSLEISLSAAKMRLYRATEELQERLGDEPPTGQEK